MTAKKLRVSLYKPLIEKITCRITSWAGKLLSYAGRLQLIKSVLLSLHVYWAQIFLIPTSVIKEIERLCRGFLWAGADLHQRRALVAWDKICQPKLHGGLGIKQLSSWNKALLCKLLWDIDRKKNRLWIRWISKYYLKGRSVWITPEGEGSWAWRALMRVKARLQSCLSLANGDCPVHSMTVAEVYKSLHGAVTVADRWWKMVWAAGIHPRLSFLLWLVSRDSLSTKDRLRRFGIVEEDSCLLCEGCCVESVSHLFFGCRYVQQVVGVIDRELQLGWKAREWQVCQEWMMRFARGKSRRATLIRGIFATTVHGVWWERNRRIFMHESSDYLTTAHRIICMYRAYCL
ncbi:hypothetical protein Dimus_038957 [Dionaea muscipula]